MPVSPEDAEKIAHDLLIPAFNGHKLLEKPEHIDPLLTHLTPLVITIRERVATATDKPMNWTLFQVEYEEAEKLYKLAKQGLLRQLGVSKSYLIHMEKRMGWVYESIATGKPIEDIVARNQKAHITDLQIRDRQRNVGGKYERLPR